MTILKISVWNTLSLSHETIPFRTDKLSRSPFYKFSGIMLCFTSNNYSSYGSDF